MIFLQPWVPPEPFTVDELLGRGCTVEEATYIVWPEGKPWSTAPAAVKRTIQSNTVPHPLTRTSLDSVPPSARMMMLLRTN